MSSNPIEDAVEIGAHGNLIAKYGYVFQCQACGKLSHDSYGTKPIDHGYDESCALNSKLVRDPRMKP